MFKRKYQQPALLGIGIGLAALSAVITASALPAFRDVFQSLSGELPMASALVLAHPGVLAAFPLMVVCVWAARRNREDRGVMALSTGILAFFAAPAIATFLMYLPIMRLG